LRNLRREAASADNRTKTMSRVFAAAAPAAICLAAIAGAARGTDVFEAGTRGAAEGLKTAVRIFPALVMLLTAVSMLRASGALDALAAAAAPAFRALGIPPETCALMIVRPVSGSAALAVGADIIARAGADSLLGRTAAVMLGSTETTFYVITVYCGAAGVKKLRYAVPAALAADFAAFFTAALSVRLLYG